MYNIKIKVNKYTRYKDQSSFQVEWVLCLSNCWYSSLFKKEKKNNLAKKKKKKKGGN